MKTSKKNPNAIDRAWTEEQLLDVTDNEGTTAVLEMLNMAGGCIAIPNGSSITSISLYGKTVNSGTFSPLYDLDNVAVVMTVAGNRIYPLPDEVYNLPYVKFVANVAGEVKIFLKG